MQNFPPIPQNIGFPMEQAALGYPNQYYPQQAMYGYRQLDQNTPMTPYPGFGQQFYPQFAPQNYPIAPHNLQKPLSSIN